MNVTQGFLSQICVQSCPNLIISPTVVMLLLCTQNVLPLFQIKAGYLESRHSEVFSRSLILIVNEKKKVLFKGEGSAESSFHRVKNRTLLSYLM